LFQLPGNFHNTSSRNTGDIQL